MQRKIWTTLMLAAGLTTARAQAYPQDYFRNPLDIPLQLVANFGEIRANHWHMGLDIRTQQRVNLPVHAAAEGYVARVSIEPGGFGQAIYINHPNGYTTLYGHLNAFFPALAQYVKNRQYEQKSWRIDLDLPPNLFPVSKGDFIALSGSTGASQGPHVHFEIRDTRTGKCLNPLLFHFPIADAVPPTVSRIALYDRSRSVYSQSPQLISTSKGIIRTGSRKVGFAVGAVDRFSGSSNPNGIYSARLLLDGTAVAGFALDRIGYEDTRYINAQIDYRYKAGGGADLQQVTPLPGARAVTYTLGNPEGVVLLNDENEHEVLIEVSDAAGNNTRRSFRIRYDPSLAQPRAVEAGERFLPNNVNVFEREDFELYTSELTIYDTVNVSFSRSDARVAGAVSPLYTFLGASIPAHDTVTVRIRTSEAGSRKFVVKNTAGSRSFFQRADVKNGWALAKFRQFGTYQLIADDEPPTVAAPPTDLTRRSGLSFTPRDNVAVRSFEAEVDGQWLRFTNNGGHTWSYTFDEHFPRGTHELTLTVEDEAGNVMRRSYAVRR